MLIHTERGLTCNEAILSTGMQRARAAYPLHLHVQLRVLEHASGWDGDGDVGALARDRPVGVAARLGSRTARHPQTSVALLCTQGRLKPEP